MTSWRAPRLTGQTTGCTLLASQGSEPVTISTKSSIVLSLLLHRQASAVIVREADAFGKLGLGKVEPGKIARVGVIVEAAMDGVCPRQHDCPQCLGRAGGAHKLHARSGDHIQPCSTVALLLLTDRFGEPG